MSVAAGVADEERRMLDSLVDDKATRSEVSALNRFICGIGKIHSNELARGSYPAYF